MVDSRGIWKIDLEPQKSWVVVFWTLEDSGKEFVWHGIDFPGPWKVRILRSCACVVVESRVLQNPPATEFYFWLLKGGYFRGDQHGLAYLQISTCLDYKLVDAFWGVGGRVLASLTMICRWFCWLQKSLRHKDKKIDMIASILMTGWLSRARSSGNEVI